MTADETTIGSVRDYVFPFPNATANTWEPGGDEADRWAATRNATEALRTAIRATEFWSARYDGAPSATDADRLAEAETAECDAMERCVRLGIDTLAIYQRNADERDRRNRRAA